jgi:predicted exporter
MRADLGAAGVRDLVVVPGRDLQAVLEGAEHAGGVLDRLAGTKLIGGFDSPANFLPSVATQEARRRSLPNDATLRANLELATATLPLRSAQLTPFLSDVAAARAAPPLTPQDLDGTSFAAGFAALVLHPNGRWVALLPLHAPQGAAGEIDAARVRNALEEADPGNAVVLDLKSESDALYASYLTQAIHLSLGGFAGIALLLLLVLKSVQRVAQILTPLALAVVAVAAMLALCGQQLNLLHLVGMLLIVAVGSNYALFFDRRRMKNAETGGSSSRETPLTLASLALANAATVVGFGMLSFCAVPILVALGTTVAPGAFLALAFAAVLSGRTAPRGVARGVGS